LVADQERTALEQLPILDTDRLENEAQLRRAMLMLSYFGHAYVWGSSPARDRVPAPVAVPWYRLSQKLGRPPVLSYASYALDNWRRFDREKPIALGNIVLLQNFLGGADEEWFILVHVDIEAKARPVIGALPLAQQAAAEGQLDDLERILREIGGHLEQMFRTLDRMPEKCDPHIYFHRVRPYIFGWKNQPAVPDGVIYEGVDDYANRPQQFRGETGAQSSIIPALDAMLGVRHAEGLLNTYLLEMRDYMPPEHRNFLAALEHGPSVRDCVIAHSADRPALRDAYNLCLHWVNEFRAKHLEYATSYIHQQSQQGAANPNSVGTGGTPFMTYLKKHLDETAQHLLPS
ncbi:MAG: indoleamine 2,3-dioxygenase, partial [Verrucomicrobiota bacterium]|nr:indoleamine 2,3-dioxygenase [Verrucomicrobiota bacterium]